jgi:hypothetical protein
MTHIKQNPAPLKPKAAYALFEKAVLREVRAQLIAINENMSNTCFIIRDLWKETTEDQRQVYYSKANQMKQCYQRHQLEEYNKDDKIEALRYKRNNTQTNEYYFPSHHIAFSQISRSSEFRITRCDGPRNKDGDCVYNTPFPSKVVDALLLVVQYQEQNEEEKMDLAGFDVSDFLYAIDNYHPSGEPPCDELTPMLFDERDLNVGGQFLNN